MASNGHDNGAYPVIGDPNKKRKANPLPVTTRFMCPEGYDPKVWQARVDLAACYHLCNKMDLNEGICNHLTVMVPGTTDRFLCIPYGLLWDEVRPSTRSLFSSSSLRNIDFCFLFRISVSRASCARLLRLLTCAIRHPPSAVALLNILLWRGGREMCVVWSFG